jgi:hypothetical protein
VKRRQIEVKRTAGRVIPKRPSGFLKRKFHGDEAILQRRIISP